MFTLNFAIKSTIFSLLLSTLGFVNFATAQNHAQPTNLKSNVLPNNSAVISWSAVEGAESYTLQYRVGSTGAWLNGGTVGIPSQVIPVLLNETVYTWRVRANASVFSSVATFKSGNNISDNTTSPAPSNSRASAISETGVALSWAAVNGAFHYTVQYREGTDTAWINAGLVTTNSLIINNLAANKTYSWRVKANCSDYSTVKVFSTNAGSSYSAY